jgi:hypothetical protein
MVGPTDVSEPHGCTFDAILIELADINAAAVFGYLWATSGTAVVGMWKKVTVVSSAAVLGALTLAGCPGNPGPAPSPTPSQPQAGCPSAEFAGLSGGSGAGHPDHFLSDYVSAPDTGAADVPNAIFTNIFLYPDPNKETWDQHLASLASASGANVNTLATSESLNAMTTALTCSSYFDLLTQYNINPPSFDGADPTVQSCVDAAVKDAGTSGVISFATMRSFASCEKNHSSLPSDQVNIFVSPDMKTAVYGESADMCGSTDNGYHGFGIGTPNWTVIPVNRGCNAGMASIMEDMSHEMVELVSDPAGFGWVHESIAGRVVDPNGADLAEQYAQGELGDICSPVGLFPTRSTPFDAPALGLGPLLVAPYWSDQDNACEPLQVADQAVAVMHGSPIIRFTGSVHILTVPVSVPAGMVSDVLDSLELLVITGGDNLNSGSSADATATFSGGQSVLTQGINQGTEWGDNTGHAVLLGFPHGLEAGSLTSITISTHFGGGLSGDNWNVNGIIVKVALGPLLTCPPTTAQLASDSTPTTLGDGSKGIVRFTGSNHTFALPVSASQADASKPVNDLQLTVNTGSDDLRGGSSPSDNASVIIALGPGLSMTFPNINQGANWQQGSTHTVDLSTLNSLPAGTTAGDLTQFTLSTMFGGGLSGDNWDVTSLTLTATLGCASASPSPSPSSSPTPMTFELLNLTGTTQLADGSTGLARFTGSVHDFSQAIPAPAPQFASDVVVDLEITLTTGADDLRGGSNGGDNASVIIALAPGLSMTFPNVNQTQSWGNNSVHTVSLTPLRPGITLASLTSVDINTMFGGGFNGDNWDLADLQLQATVLP